MIKPDAFKKYITPFFQLLFPTGEKIIMRNHGLVSQNNLEKHVKAVVATPEYRNHENLNSLNLTADYIYSKFKMYSNRIVTQVYKVNDKEYKNIICSFGPEEGERIVVGAHYDVFENQPGADDNASGVAGMLEIARLLHEFRGELKCRIDLAAYTLEEPPFFRTENMGSAVHAKSLADSDVKVKLMVCIDMIGFYSELKKSQKFPLKCLSWLCPPKADFIVIVSNFPSHFATLAFKKLMESRMKMDVRQATAPASVKGVDFSDHLNFWKYGYHAFMLTDTALLRNKNYHKVTDTFETLDFVRMTDVVNGTFHAIVNYE